MRSRPKPSPAACRRESASASPSGDTHVEKQENSAVAHSSGQNPRAGRKHRLDSAHSP